MSVLLTSQLVSKKLLMVDTQAGVRRIGQCSDTFACMTEICCLM